MTAGSRQAFMLYSDMAETLNRALLMFCACIMAWRLKSCVDGSMICAVSHSSQSSEDLLGD